MTSTSLSDSGPRVSPRAMRAALLIAMAAALVAGCQTSSTATDVTTAPDAAPKCQVTLGTPAAIEANGGTATVSVTTQPECSWNASSTVNWISGLSPGSGQGARDLEFRVAANDGSAVREGEIVVNDSRVRVSQKAPCRYSLSPAAQNVSANGGTGAVAITAGSDCSWTATSDSGWLNVTGTTSGRGNGTVSFSVPANSGPERTGTVNAGGQRAAVTQAAVSAPAPSPGPGPAPNPSCTYTISPASQDFAALGGSGSISVATQSGCQWSASSGASWISTAASGTGNGSAGFSVAANLGGARSGTITVAGRSFTVNQAAVVSPPPPPPPPTCNYSVSPTNVKIGKGGDSKSVKVDTSNGCSWTASSNTSWITISPASGTGDGNVSISAPRNTGGKRTGSVTVAGQTVTVEQDGD